MNMRTPYFRAALTIAAIWIAAFAYHAFSGYRDAYRSTDFALYGVPDEETYRCQSTVLDATKPDFQFRAQTSAERSECYRSATEAHVRSVESGNQFALEQAWKSFGWSGALPALLLLAVVAFWTFISSGLGRAGSGYLHWLRFGSTKLGGADTDHDP